MDFYLVETPTVTSRQHFPDPSTPVTITGAVVSLLDAHKKGGLVNHNIPLGDMQQQSYGEMPRAAARVHVYSACDLHGIGRSSTSRGGTRARRMPWTMRP